MSNTVSLLSYANTFGDWIVTTNALAKENNDIAANNYTKPTGTLYLNDPTLGLQVANNAIFGGTMQVVGVGSSAYVQNSFRVDGAVNLTNTQISLVAAGIVYANGSANGIIVANNALVKGNVYGSAVYSGPVELKTYVDTANTFLQANDRSVLTIAQAYTDTANSFLKSYTDTANTFLKSYTDTANTFLQANDRSVLTIAQAYTDTSNNFLQANDRNVLTLALNYTNAANTFLQANDRNVLTLAQSYTDTANAWIQANISSRVVTANVNTGRISVGTLVDANNASGYFNQLSVGAGGLFVTGAFTVSGTTVYNIDTFTLNAGQTTAQNGYLVNNRGTSGANAVIRWNESSTYWDIRDVNNPTSYSQILTANLISDSVTSISSSTIASSKAANTILTYVQGVNNTQNTNISSANTLATSAYQAGNTNATNITATNTFAVAGYAQANAANTLATAGYNQANLTQTYATSAYNQANLTQTYATSSYTQANAANTLAVSSYNQANLTQTYATSGYAQANAANTLAVSAYQKANAAVNIINGTVGTGAPNNLGTITFASNNGVVISAQGNTFYINDSQDVRTSASPTFAGLTLTSALGISQGGTGASSQGAALTNLLPTGTNAGYVLTTGGPGSFYWAAASGGGGGATPGTTINSTRLTYTGNGSANTYTAPTYTPGASQLRVYFDGVRQFASEYTETSNTSVTFTSPVPSGVNILLEVDGYINNPYYANNIAYTVNANISPTANTIQLAIDGLTSKLTYNYANTSAAINFTNLITATTPSVNTSNTQVATTAFVQSVLNNSNTFTHSITGSAGSVANTGITGLITSAQIASVATTQLTGTITASQLGTTSNVQFASIGVGTTPDTANTGSIRATNNITAYYSDERLKTKLGNIENALEKVQSLNGFYYEANEIAQALGYTVKREVGVSAQEVQNVLPEIIAPAPIDDKYLTVHYDRLIPLLIEAIKELKQEIDNLKGDNK